MSEYRVKIERMVFGGYGLGHINNSIIFVPYSAPGDELIVKVVSSRKGVSWGEIKEVITPSPDRNAPFCPHYTQCGGCQWQHISYPAQLEHKRLIIQDCLKRIGGLHEVKINAYLPSPLQQGYRNRIRLHWEKNKGLGFYKSQSHEVVTIKNCPLLPESINICLEQLSDCLQNNPPKKLKEVQLISGEGGQVILGLIMDAFPATNLRESFKNKVAASGASILVGEQKQILWGEDVVNIGVGNWKFKTGSGSFFQANLAILPDMVQYILKNIDSYDSGVELYSGVGLFSIPLAGRLKKLFAVELNKQAVQEANVNLSANGVKNAIIYSLSSEDGLDLLARGEIKPTLLLADPPRDGLSSAVMNSLLKMPLRQITYVSCNPSTLARDLKILCSAGYKIVEIQPLDMFPHTAHIECITVLSR